MSVRGIQDCDCLTWNNGRLGWLGVSFRRTLRATTGHRGLAPRAGTLIILILSLLLSVLDHLTKICCPPVLGGGGGGQR